MAVAGSESWTLCKVDEKCILDQWCIVPVFQARSLIEYTGLINKLAGYSASLVRPFRVRLSLLYTQLSTSWDQAGHGRTGKSGKDTVHQSQVKFRPAGLWEIPLP